MNELSSLSGIVGKRKREEEQLSTLSSVKTRGNTPYESRPLSENHVGFAWTKRISFSCETGDEQRTNQETRIRKNASRWRLIKMTSIAHFSCPFASMHRDRFTSLLIAAVVVGDDCRSQSHFFYTCKSFSKRTAPSIAFDRESYPTHFQSFAHPLPTKCNDTR